MKYFNYYDQQLLNKIIYDFRNVDLHYAFYNGDFDHLYDFI